MESTNFDIDQGSTFTIDIKIVDNNNAPVDLTGVTFNGQIRKTASSDHVVGTFSFITNPTDLVQGIFSATLSAADTSTLPCHHSPVAARSTTQFAYDMESRYPDGSIERILSGVLNVSPEVTR